MAERSLPSCIASLVIEIVHMHWCYSLLLYYYRRSAEYGSLVWDNNMNQGNALLYWVELKNLLAVNLKHIMWQLEGIWVWIH